MSDGTGYLTPDPPDPPDVICITWYVPNDRLYIAAMWGAYQFMTNWNAWARDPLHKGKEAARVWKAAFNKARDRWLLTQGRCDDMITGLRAKPLEPCVLQMQTDSGEWVDIFDASCCGGSGSVCLPQLRVNGGTIEQYNPATGKWEPVGPTTPPQETPITPPPFPPSSDGACIAATNFGALIENRKNKFATAVGGALTIGDTVLQGFDLLISLFTFGWVMSILGTLIGGLYTDMLLVYAAVAAYDIEEMAICLALPHYTSEGQMSQAEVDNMLVEIQVLIDSFTPLSPEAVAWRYVYSWVKAAGPTGMQTASTFMGITNGACESCPWSHTVYFQTGPEGFTVGDFNPDPAFYNAGYITASGWTMALMPHTGGPVPELDIKRLIPSTTLVKVEVEYTSVHGDEPNVGGRRIVVQGVEIESDWGTGDAVAEFEFDPPIGISDLHVQAEGRSSGNPLPTAKCTIHQITYSGTGTNPFDPALPPVTP